MLALAWVLPASLLRRLEQQVGCAAGGCRAAAARVPVHLHSALQSMPRGSVCVICLQAWRSFVAAQRAGALDAHAAPPLERGSKAAALHVLLPAAVAMPALAMHASGAGVALSLTAAAAAALTLAGAPPPRPRAAQPAVPSAGAHAADWRALEEAATAHLAWWPGAPGWLAVTLLLATCWQVIDLFQGTLR